jgi:hypothetical protein
MVVQSVPTTSEPNLGEIGTALVSGTSIYTDREMNPNLVGGQAIRTYDKMRRTDASVRSSLRVIKAPLLAAQWYFEPASNSDQDKLIAEFVEWCWNQMSRTSIQVLWEALLMLDYGYYAFEKVFEYATWRPSTALARERTVARWKKWAPRHPLNTSNWVFDAHGGVKGLKQWQGHEEVTIPIELLLIFTLDEEGGNPEGISILRSAYKHWYMKDVLYKVDAIQKERHGIGIPVAIPGEGSTSTDKALALKLVENIRTNEKAGIVLPSERFILKFLELTGNPVNVLESAVHHDLMIKSNVLAQFLALGTQASGSRAVGSVQEDIFIKSSHYIADLLRSVINKWAIPELVTFNFGLQQAYPELKVRRIGDTTDTRALSVALRNAVESGLITPDQQTEEWLRDTMDFPRASDEALARTSEERLSRPANSSQASSDQRTQMPADGA